MAAEAGLEYDYAVVDAKTEIVSQLSNANFVLKLIESERGSDPVVEGRLELLILSLGFLLDHARQRRLGLSQGDSDLHAVS